MTTLNKIPAFFDRVAMRKGLLALFFAVSAIFSSNAQTLDFQLNPVVANDTLFIEYYVTDNGLVAGGGQGFGPTELPIYFDDTTLFNSTDATISFRGVWDQANTPNHYNPMTFAFVNDSVLNLLINPFYLGSPSASDPTDPTHPAGAFITPGGPQQHIATIAIPIKTCGDINVNWVPTGLPNSGSRLLWDGTDASNAGTNYLANASPNPITLSTNSLVVTTLADEGCGSLREAIVTANALAGPDTITFDPSLQGGTINVGSTSGLPLPTINTDSVFIDAQIDEFNCIPDITLDGSSLAGVEPGIEFFASNGSGIQELTIQNFPGNGVTITNASSNCQVLFCHIGVDSTGTVAEPNGGNGVLIQLDSRLNVISVPFNLNCVLKNIISNNGLNGVLIDIGCDSNIVNASYIGTGFLGTESFGNTQDGIEIQSVGNFIGDPLETTNVISNNPNNGIEIIGAGGNIIQNNIIGTNAGGTASLPNLVGININSGSNANVIGGDLTIGEGNLISGNLDVGILLSGVTNTVIHGNNIGLNSTGTGTIPNTEGLSILNSSFTLVGNGSVNERNTISGNTFNGIGINGGITNVITGNNVGVNLAGIGTTLGNGNSGISIDASTSTYIGGASVDSANIISANTANGILVNNSDTTWVIGNRIGTDISGTVDLGNGQHGVSFTNGSSLNIVGLGRQLEDANVISGNGNAGISVDASDSTFIIGNAIGVDGTGLVALPNANEGIVVTNSSVALIGDTGTFERNIISGNGDEGIEFNNVDDSYIVGNIIGKDGAANSSIPNNSFGILVDAGSTNDTIIYNHVAFSNGANGIMFDAATTFGNIVWFNSIHSNGGNLEGIEHLNGSQGGIGIPIITDLTVSGGDTILSGTAAPSGLIQIYCDSLHEGQVLFDTTMADAGGNWSKIMNGYGANIVNGLDSITVLMDDGNNTSKFSEPISKIVACDPPVVSLGLDSNFCAGDSTQLFVTDYGLGSVYEWYSLSGGPTLQKTSASNVDTVYYVTFADDFVVVVDSAGTGCTNSDTITMTSTPAPSSVAGLDQAICSTDTASLLGVFANSSAIYWSNQGTGTGTFIPDSISSNAQYVPSSADSLAGSVDLFFTVEGNGACQPDVDTMTLTLDPAPTVDIQENDTTLCGGVPLPLNGSVTGGTGVNWHTTGAGSFNTSTSLTPTYTFDPTDLGSTIQIILESTGNGNCNPAYDTIDVTYQTLVVDLGNDTSLCANSYLLEAGANFGATYTWTDSVGTIVQGPTVDDSTFSVTTSHKYFVTADFAGCQVEDSAVVTLSSGLATPFNALYSTSTGTSVSFVFDSVPDVLSYTVYVDTCGSGGPCSTFGASPFTVFPASNPESYTVSPMNLLDSAIFWVRANGPCDSIYSDTVGGVADTCNASFTGLNSSYCVSSFLDKMYANFPSPTDSFYILPASNAVKHATSPSDFWYFDPAEAGPGTHWVYHIGCAGASLDSFEVQVDGAPCVDDVVDDSTSSAIKSPRGLFTDCDGQIYTSSNQINALVLIDTFGFASIIAGDSTSLGFMDGHINVATLNSPIGLVVDPSNVVYWVDGGNHAIRMLRNDTVYTIAGNGVAGTTDGVPGAAAQFNQPFSIALSQDLTKLYVSESHRVRVIDITTPAYNVSTLAGGTGNGDISGVAGAAARFDDPRHIISDGTYLYLADQNNRKIKRINETTGFVEDYILTGGFGVNEGHRLTTATGFSPTGISVDAEGTVFFSDENACVIRKMQDDTTSLFAGDYFSCSDASGSALTARFDEPGALSVFSKGFLDVADVGNDKIKRIAITDYLKSPLRNVDTNYCFSNTVDTLASTTFGGVYTGTGVDSAGGVWRFTPSTVGTYNICYNYTSGYCSDSLCVEVTVHPTPVLDLGPDTIICASQLGVDSLVIDSNFSSIQWTVNSIASATDTNYWRIQDAAGEYIVDVIDTNGCANTDTVNLSLEAPIQVQITSDMTDSICYADTATLTTSIISGGPGILSSSWNTGDTTITTQAYFSGDYVVSVVDSNGCVGDTMFRSIVRNAPSVCFNVNSALTGSNGARYGEWSVSTIAGDTNIAPGQVNGQAYSASFNSPWDVYFDNGFLYVTESTLGGQVRRIDLSDTSVTTYIGGGGSGLADSIGRLNATFNNVTGIEIDPNGNFYFVQGDAIHFLDVTKDSVYHLTGGAATFADGHISIAQFNSPQDIAMDGFGNIFLADYANQIVRGIYIDDTVRTVSGQPSSGGITAGDPSVSQNASPWGVGFDPAGQLYIGNETFNSITHLDLDTIHYIDIPANFGGNLTYFTNTHQSSTPMRGTWNVVSDKTGKIFITEGSNHYISVLDPFDSVKVIAGDLSGGAPASGYSDGLGGTSGFNFPTGITMDHSTGDLYVADRNNHLIRKLTKNKTLAICSSDTIDVDGTCPGIVSYMWSGPVVFADATNPVQRLNAVGTYVLTVQDAAGCSNSDSIIITHLAPPVVSAGPDTTICPGDSIDLFTTPFGWASYAWNGPNSFTSTDSLITIADSGQYMVTVTDANGCIGYDTVNVSMNAIPNFALPNIPDQCVGDVQTLTIPANPMIVGQLWSDSTTANTFDVTKGGIYSVELFLANGCSTTVTDTAVYNLPPTVGITTPNKSSSDVFVSTLTTGLNKPRGLVEASNGDLFVADFGAHVIRRIDPSTGIATVFAGQVATPDLVDGLGGAARFSHPRGIAIDQYDNLYVADMDSNVIRKITPGGLVTTYAGLSYDDDPLTFPNTFNDGNADSALFKDPTDVAVDGSGGVWVTDAGNHAIRLINPVTKQVVSAGTPGTSGGNNGGLGAASFNDPQSILYHESGFVFIGEVGKVRIIDPVNGVVADFNNSLPGTITGLNVVSGNNLLGSIETTHQIQTISPVSSATHAGSPPFAGLIDGWADTARFSAPFGMEGASDGRIYVADDGNNAIRYIYDSCHVRICTGDTIDLTSSASTAGGTYNWSTGASGAAATSIQVTTGGTYFVEYVDPTTGCSGYDTIIVNEFPIPTFSFVTSDSTICQSGTVDLVATGIQPTDTIVWRDAGGTILSFQLFSDTITIDSSSLGSYTATILNGCSNDTTVTVTANDLQAIAGGIIGADTVNVCFGDTAILDGRLSNSGVPFTTGATVPYAYSWSGTGGTVVGSTTNDTVIGIRGGVAPGSYETYYLDVTDSLGCTQRDSVVVYWADSLNIDAGNDTAICLGSSVNLNGVASLGITPYTDISWVDTSGSEVFVANANPITATPNDTTAYVVTVTDAIGCTASDSITVFPVELIVDAGLDDTICPNTSSNLMVNVTSGIGPYSFAWEPAATLDDSTLQAPTASPVTTTQYIISVYDSTLTCSTTDTVVVIVNDLQAIAGNLDGIDPGDTINVCFGDTATLDAQLTNGGFTPYTYAWTASGTFTGTIINGTLQQDRAFGGTSGNYDLFYVTVTDSVLCTDLDSVVVFWNPEIVADAGNDTAICLGNSVTLTGSAIGGSGTHTFNWIDTSGTAVFIGNPISVTPTDTTMYVVQVTDSLGCVDFDSVVVFPVELIVDAGLDDTICPNTTSSLMVNVTSGIGPFSFAWEPAATLDDSTLQAPTASPIATTQYIVFVYDSTLTCSTSDTVIVIVNDLQAIAGGVIGADTVNVCFGDTAVLDGRLSNSGVPFTSGATVPYAYSWTGTGGSVIGSTTNDTVVGIRGAVAPGSFETYFLDVTDSLGCTERDSVVVFWNYEIVADAGNDTSICLGNSVTLTGTAIGGSGSHTINWIDTSGTVVFVGNPISVTPTDTTLYVVQVTDSLGCIDFDSVVVFPVELIIDAGIDDTICLGGNSILNVNVTSGIGPYGYAWSPAVTLDDSTLQSPTATPIITTEYIVNVIDSTLGCRTADSVIVVVNDLQAIAGVIDGIDPGDTINVCFGDTATLDGSLTNGGETPYAFSWSAAGSFTGSLPSSVNQIEQAFGGTPGTFDIFYLDVRDSRPCVDQDSLVVYWNLPLTVAGSPDTAYTCSGGSDSIFATAAGGDGTYGYSWTTITGSAVVGNSNLDSTIVTTSDTSTVEIEVTDGFGCTASDTIVAMSVDFQIDAVAQFDTICPNLNDSLSVSIVSGGVGPYSYAWAPAANLDDSTLATPAANVSTTTTFTVDVTDNFTGCTNSDNVTITIIDLIAEAGTILDPIDDTLVACFGDTMIVDGMLSNGGTPFSSIPYTFAWTVPGGITVTGGLADTVVRVSGGAPNTTSEIDLIITDSLGCTARDSAYVYWNDEILLTVIPAIVNVCNSDTGIVTGTESGGSGLLSYNWTVVPTGGANLINPTGNPLQVTLNDTSVVVATVTDERGCFVTDSSEVRNISFSNTIVPSSPDACIDQTDTLTATVSGGIGPFGYVWSNGSTADTALVTSSVIGANTYNVTVFDSTTMCSLVDSITINIYDMSVFAGNDTMLCSSNTLLQLNGVITGGVGGFQHIWHTPNDTANYHYTTDTAIVNPVFDVFESRNVVPWYYLLYTAVDANGCVRTDTVRARRTQPFQYIDPSGVNDPYTICETDSVILGSLPNTTFQNVGGGVAPISYSWSSVSGTTNVDGSTQQHPVYVPTGAGTETFMLSAVDSAGCIPGNNFDLTVISLASPVVDLGLDTFLCTGSSINIFNLLTNTGTTNEWRQGTLGSGVISTNDTLGVSALNTYFLTVTDGGVGCSNTDSIFVDEEAQPIITISPFPAGLCSNENITLVATEGGGTRGATQTWTTSNGNGSINEPDSLSTFYIPNISTDPNSLDFTITYTTVCNTVVANATATTIPGPDAGFIASPTNIFPGDQVTLTDTTSGTINSHTWIFGSGTTPDSAFTVGPHIVTYDNPGLIPATLIVEDGNGCFDTAVVIIDVVSTKVLYVPNVMSPQAANVENQVTKVYGINISTDDFEFTIYNRWGEMIYQTTDFVTANTIGWDGTHQTSGEDQDAGVYTYTLKGVFYDGNKFDKTGTITVIR